MCVRTHEGSLGWRTAQESCLIAGWAGSVIGAMAKSEEGKVFVFGKRMGEMKAGHFSREIEAKLSTMSKVLGHWS